MYERKRFLVIVVVAFLTLFMLNPSTVLAGDNSGLPSLQALVNQLSEKVDTIITKLISTNNSVTLLQEQVSVQQSQIDQLQKQIDELKKPGSGDALTAPITISIASFSGVRYDGQTFPMEYLKNKTILITNAANVSKTYLISTDSDGKATVTLPAGLYFIDFNPNAEIRGSQFFLVTDKVPNPKIALVSYYGSFQIISNIDSGTEIGPTKYDEGNYLSRF